MAVLALSLDRLTVTDLKAVEARVKMWVWLICFKTNGMNGRQVLITPAMGSRPAISAVRAAGLV